MTEIEQNVAYRSYLDDCNILIKLMNERRMFWGEEAREHADYLINYLKADFPNGEGYEAE